MIEIIHICFMLSSTLPIVQPTPPHLRSGCRPGLHFVTGAENAPVRGKTQELHTAISNGFEYLLHNRWRTLFGQGRYQTMLESHHLQCIPCQQTHRDAVSIRNRWISLFDFIPSRSTKQGDRR